MSNVPQLTRNTQILATPHQRITLTRLNSRRYTVRIKVFLFSSCNRYQSPHTDESVFTRDDLVSDVCLATRCKTPAAWTEGFVENAAVFDFGEVNQSIYTSVSVRMRTNTNKNKEKIYQVSSRCPMGL